MQLSRYSNLIASYTTADADATMCVDCEGCEGVIFTALPGTSANSTHYMTLSAGNTTATLVACNTQFAMCSTATGHFLLEIDVYKPAYRYLNAIVSHTANCPTWILARKYGLRLPLEGGYTVADSTNMEIDNEGVTRVISPTSVAQ